MAPSAAKDALLRGLHAALTDGSLADFTPKALEAIAANIFEHVTAEARTLERSAVTALPARLLVLSRKDLCDALAYGLARRVCDANAVATSADAFAAALRRPAVLRAVLATDPDAASAADVGGSRTSNVAVADASRPRMSSALHVPSRSSALGASAPTAATAAAGRVVCAVSSIVAPRFTCSPSTRHPRRRSSSVSAIAAVWREKSRSSGAQR